MVRIIVPGKPIAQKRPRFFRRGNHVGTYSDQVTEAGRFQIFIKNAIKPDFSQFDGTLSLDVSFHMPIPKSWPKKRRLEATGAIVHHSSKPDLSNLVKFVEDCCNGILWRDDAQISIIVALKRYSDDPRTEITVREIR